MIDVSAIDHIYLAQGFTDLRKGIDGYSALVAGTMQLDPFSNSLFLFCNRNKDKLKVLHWNGNGFWLFYKRLESGKLKWPKPNEQGAVYLSQQQLNWLLEGLDIYQKRAFKPMKNKVI